MRVDFERCRVRERGRSPTIENRMGSKETPIADGACRHLSRLPACGPSGAVRPAAVPSDVRGRLGWFDRHRRFVGCGDTAGPGRFDGEDGTNGIRRITGVAVAAGPGERLRRCVSPAFRDGNGDAPASRRSAPWAARRRQVRTGVRKRGLPSHSGYRLAARDRRIDVFRIGGPRRRTISYRFLVD